MHLQVPARQPLVHASECTDRASHDPQLQLGPPEAVTMPLTAFIARWLQCNALFSGTPRRLARQM